MRHFCQIFVVMSNDELSIDYISNRPPKRNTAVNSTETWYESIRVYLRRTAH